MKRNTLSFLLMVVWSVASPAYAAFNFSDVAARIIGGGFVPEINKYPFMANYMAIENTSNGTEITTCGATIISEYFLLTAAHCLKPNAEMTVFFGNLEREVGDSRKVVQAIPHPNHIREVQHDIALLKVDQKINFNEVVQPVKLPRKDCGQKVGKVMTVLGWGMTDPTDPKSTSKFLKELNVRTVENIKCTNDGLTPHENDFCIDNLDRSNTIDSFCNGDSGGPAVSNGVQYGVISRSLNCSSLGEILTSVSDHQNFISSTTGIDPREFVCDM